MKILKHLLLMTVFVVGLSMTATAQKNDDQKRPPKNPPTIDPGKKEPKEKPPSNDNRNNDNRGKKPSGIIFMSGNRSEINFV